MSGVWIAIFISMAYFLIYFRCDNKISYQAGFIAVLLAVFIQSAQVYGYLENRMYKIQQDAISYERSHRPAKRPKMAVYYVMHWFDILVEYVDPQVLEDYRNHQFIIYDNVVPYKDSPQFLKAFESSLASNNNIAYVSNNESNIGDWKSDLEGSSQADLDGGASGKITILGSDANTWKIKTHLPSSQFLVINDNYDSHWHAFINGRPSHIFRANVSFMGLWVPSGESNIVLRYSTPLCYALHISLIVLFAGTFLYLLVLLRKRYA